MTTARKGKRWSAAVSENSDALDIKDGTFAKDSPKAVAHALKKSAEASDRRKASPFQAAMSMLNFFINRAGRNLPKTRRKVLEEAKEELRHEFHRDEPKPTRRAPAKSKASATRKKPVSATRKKPVSATRKKLASAHTSAERR